MIESLVTEPTHAQGAAPSPQAGACVSLWVAAIRLYASDCRSAANPRIKGADRGQALADLRGSRRMLAQLCEPLGFDVDIIAQSIENALTTGGWAPRPGAKQAS